MNKAQLLKKRKKLNSLKPTNPELPSLEERRALTHVPGRVKRAANEEQKRKLYEQYQRERIMPQHPLVEMKIVLDPNTDNVTVNGPLPNVLLCMHMMGKGMQAIGAWNAEQLKKQQMGIVGGGDIIAAPAGALDAIERSPRPEFIVPGQ